MQRSQAMVRPGDEGRPPLRQLGSPPGRLGQVARRWVAAHPAGPVTRAARRATYALTALLHTENHDPASNGELRVLSCLGPSAGCILDVGAHHGAWAVLALGACPSATVHCFEIASPVRERLRANLAGVPRVRVPDAGLLDFDGTVEVKHYPEDSELSSVADYPHPGPAAWYPEQVRTGDAYLEAEGIPEVDLLKVDAEGSDLRVLEGFRRSFEEQRIAAAQFEYGYAGILTGALLYRFYAFFEPLGFQIGQVLPDRVAFRSFQLTDERFVGPNFLAVRWDRPDLIQRLAGGD